MILEILKKSEKIWRDIAKLATPLDSEKPVILTGKPRNGDFEAYTDNSKIYINVDENKFKKNLETIVIPAYRAASHILYGVNRPASDSELLTNLALDTFLFVHFHEQLHPWVCPNSKFDEKKISKALFDGIKKAEKTLTPGQAMFKVNNSKNLIWDSVLNISFLSKTLGFNNDDLMKKIVYVFQKENRQIEYQPILKYPAGILPIVYIISANNRTTDIPISLMGSMYSTLSFNDNNVRKRALDFFIDDLNSKRISSAKTIEILKQMYSGFVNEVDASLLQNISINKKEFEKRINLIDRIGDSDYTANQEYFISALTKIFDSPSTRYDSLKGFIQVLSQYISLSEKQGSPDANTGGGGGGGGSGGGGSSSSSGGGDGDGEDEEDDSDGDGSGSGGGGGNGKDGKEKGDGRGQDEIDSDSLSDTLDDLLGELDGKEAGDLLGEVANPSAIGKGRGAGRGTGKASVINNISIIAADEYYKRNSERLEVKNASEEMFSLSMGDTPKWKLVRTDILSATDVARLNHAKIVSFQKVTGLPVLIRASPGVYKLNEYILERIPRKSYSFQKTGIEIPDNWIFVQDSSGSMTGDRNYVGSGDKFDLLQRVKYGLMGGVSEAAKQMKKHPKFGIVDFSDTTRYSGLDDLIKIYEAKTHPVKLVSLIPQCGGTTLNPKVFERIIKDLAPGRTLCNLVTDGDIYDYSNSLYKEIEKFASRKDSSFVFVEVGANTQFGNDMKKLAKKNPAVLYFHVNSIKSIKEQLGNVLVKYN